VSHQTKVIVLALIIHGNKRSDGVPNGFKTRLCPKIRGRFEIFTQVRKLESTMTPTSNNGCRALVSKGYDPDTNILLALFEHPPNL
jgi:hypothetical protein